jgi:drug/metabolite transporter (DMT)-like permease
LKPTQFAVLLALGITWGASFLFIKVLVDEIDPVLIVAGRILFGVAVMAAIVALRQLPLPSTRTAYAWILFLAAFGSTLPFLLITWGETEIDSGSAAVLNASVPLFTAVISIWFLSDEYLSPSKVMGLTSGFFGVAILSGADLFNLGRDALLGDLSVIAASLSYAFAAVVARRHLRGENPISLGACQLAFALLLIAPLTLALEPPSAAAQLEVGEWLAWLALGFAGTGLAYWAYYWLIAEVGAVKATMVTYILPAVGVFLGWAVLDESLGWNTLAGLVLIVAGIALVNEVAVGDRLRRPLLEPQPARPPEPLPEPPPMAGSPVGDPQET